MEEEAPNFWMQRISSELANHDAIPLFGNAPPWDFARFSSLVSANFGVPNLHFSERGQRWCKAEEIQEGLGKDILLLPLKIGPLSGSAFWIMSKNNIAKLTSWMLHGKGGARPLSSKILTEGFYRFLALQVLDSVSKLDPMQNLSVILSEESLAPETDAFCIDIDMQFDQYFCWGRLVIEPTLRKDLAEHFSTFPFRFPKTSLELPLNIQIGKTSLTLDEWETAAPGDVLLFERCDPTRGYLALRQKPLFQVKIKHHRIELIDYASTYEETMQSNNSSEEHMISLKETPISLTVELARLNMTLEKLTELKPGNFLELPIHPDQSVNLVVNGQRIGRGELVRLGETLGIRILEKG